VLTGAHRVRADVTDAARRSRPRIVPGVPPAIAKSLAQFEEDLRAARTQADIVVASHHWELFEDVLDYQVEIAHAAIEAGADAVKGHGPHYACAVEMYQGKPIF
jgi:poly-gamma-glutamate capsule biosynthesis protein CapA/YwtB (metallophosphatase superfamily)